MMKFKGLIVLAIAMVCLTPNRVKAEELTVVDEGWLRQIAMAEAEGEGVEGKAAVMRVVLNRVADERYPGTISEVIFEPGQFSTAKIGGRMFTVQADAECVAAMELVKSGWDKTNGALFFCTSKPCWQTANRKYLLTLGNHKFYK